MPDTTAKIRAKGLDATGVTEDIANQMYAHKGKHYMAVVEFKVEERHEKADGTRKVDLILTQVEPAASEDMDEHLRELVRTCYYNRGTGDQPQLPAGSEEPTVAAVLAAGEKHRPHAFSPADTADADSPCECGLAAAAGVHSSQDTLDDADAPDDELADEIDRTAEAADKDQWEYDAPEGSAIASTVPDPFTTPEPATT